MSGFVSLSNYVFVARVEIEKRDKQNGLISEHPSAQPPVITTTPDASRG